MLASAERKWLALALLCVVQFMVVLDIAIVNVALPSIQVDLGFSQENLQWVISAYALMFGGFLLLGGRAADLLGRRRLFIGGLVVFSAASLLSGLAWSDDALIVSRAFQGLGAAIITPAALSILMTTFTEGRERNAALGVWGAVGAFGAVAGVLLGGILTDLLSWEWTFYINVPVGLGFSFVPISIAALAGVQRSEAGLASGLFNTSQQIGGALGIAVLSAVATSTTKDEVQSGTAVPNALTDGFEAAFIWGGIVAAAGILVALLLVRRRDLEAQVEEIDEAPEPVLEAA